ncbi:hypothetical protein CGZ93_17575 [Enemella dayhoffiae]|uniref:SDR family oxidoreductase n=1 Tax=Enemella dayhoffiae TaxID=2016507 RepID=A0A255GTW1_9ACTN|nr:SDR family oxidoreductase [Enemella dayhoffiae]OYO16574.1 hypothetical protein CGZ93_17575 [Enemella dayhoffiae]
MDLGFEQGQLLLVTGAGSGIGRTVALRAAEVGLSVAAWDRDPDSLAQTVQMITAAGAVARGWRVDVGEPDDIQQAMAQLGELGRPHFLVNNAGPPSSAELDFDEAVTLCLGSMRRVLHAWLEHTSPEAGLPAVVNLASVAGNRVGTASDWYSAAKAGISGWTRHLAAYRSDEVRANAVAPGMVDTPRLAGFASSAMGRQVLQRIPLGRMASPDDIAWTVLFLLSPLGSYINGQTVVVDGGWTVTQ